MKRRIIGLVLCGGASSRMGEDKGSLIIRPGVTQLDYTLQLLEPLCERLAVGLGSTSRKLPPGVEAIQDAENVQGPMAAVVSALRENACWPVLVVACDMPYLEISHLVQLVNRRDPKKDATAFVAADGMPEPMCSLYEASCLSSLESSIELGMFSLRRFLGGTRLERIALDRAELLASVNRPSELEKARQTLS